MGPKIADIKCICENSTAVSCGRGESVSLPLRKGLGKGTQRSPSDLRLEGGHP